MLPTPFSVGTGAVADEKPETVDLKLSTTGSGVVTSSTHFSLPTMLRNELFSLR